VESFNGKLRDELINREVFTTLLEAKTLIGDWRRQYNEVRPYSSLSGIVLQLQRPSSQL
jgi:putative transposase